MFSLSEEYSNLAQSMHIDWAQLEGSAVLITGATGLIGSLCTRLLLERNRLYKSGIRVVAFVRNLEKAQDLFSGYSVEDGLEYVVGDLDDTSALNRYFDYVIHAGCPTASHFFINHPVETATTIVDGTRHMLELARAQECKSFIYISSMEVYGTGNSQPGLDHLLTEEEVGYVDPLNIRSCYPEGKRMAELLCCAYAHQYGMQVSIARLAQTFGAGISPSDKRIFAQFARSAMTGSDIVLKTPGLSTRMYVYTADAVLAIFTILLSGEAGRAYNVAHEKTYSSVYEMAHMVAEKFSRGKSQVRVEVDENAPYPPEHHLPLDTTAIRQLGWRPEVNLCGMFDRLIAYFETEDASQ